MKGRRATCRAAAAAGGSAAAWAEVGRARKDRVLRGELPSPNEHSRTGNKRWGSATHKRGADRAVYWQGTKQLPGALASV